MAILNTTTNRALVLVGLLLAGCGDDGHTPVAPDWEIPALTDETEAPEAEMAPAPAEEVDAGTDAGTDADVDARTDARPDAGVDGDLNCDAGLKTGNQRCN